MITYSFSKDPSLDSAQRIAVLTQKLSELRKTYADVKAELAAVERRRKKIRRREREGKKIKYFLKHIAAVITGFLLKFYMLHPVFAVHQEK